MATLFTKEEVAAKVETAAAKAVATALRAERKRLSEVLKAAPLPDAKLEALPRRAATAVVKYVQAALRNAPAEA